MVDQTTGRWDVAVIGGGPAGLAAGLFAARHGLRTAVLDRGRSSLRQCAYLDNYLGFPGGIAIPAFLDLARAHAIQAGCELVRERAIALERVDGDGARFLVATARGSRLAADRVVAASPYDAGYLATLGDPDLLDEAGAPRAGRIDAEGRTGIDGLYLAGPLAGVESQALISAGHGAQVALALIRDLRRADGLWDALARHLDWQVWRGCYDADGWEDRVRAHFAASLPAGWTGSPARAAELVERWIRAKRAQQLDPDEVARRSARGCALLAEHLERWAPAIRRLQEQPA